MSSTAELEVSTSPQPTTKPASAAAPAPAAAEPPAEKASAPQESTSPSIPELDAEKAEPEVEAEAKAEAEAESAPEEGTSSPKSVPVLDFSSSTSPKTQLQQPPQEDVSEPSKQVTSETPNGTRSETPTMPIATKANNNNVPISGSSVSENLTVDDLEDVLMELNNYEKNLGKDKPIEIPSLLEGYLKFVAHSGCTHFPWVKVKWLFRAKLENVISDYYESCPIDDIPMAPNVDVFHFTSVKDKVFEQLDSFSGIPFTIQRIAELLTCPKRHYRRTDKFMRALEKNMLIVSTIEARSQNQSVQEDTKPTFMNGDHSLSENLLTPTSSSLKEQLKSPSHSSNGCSNVSSVAAERTARWAAAAAGNEEEPVPAPSSSGVSSAADEVANVDLDPEDEKESPSKRQGDNPQPEEISTSSVEDEDHGESPAKRKKLETDSCAEDSKITTSESVKEVEQDIDEDKGNSEAKSDDDSQDQNAPQSSESSKEEQSPVEGPCDSLAVSDGSSTLTDQVVANELDDKTPPSTEGESSEASSKESTVEDNQNKGSEKTDVAETDPKFEPDAPKPEKEDAPAPTDGVEMEMDAECSSSDSNILQVQN